jgi:peptidyl-prolyl cis-trans isomerase SurA
VQARAKCAKAVRVTRLSRRRLRSGLARIAALGALLTAFVWARPAHAIIVERIVAVVGERVILLSELRHRAIPRLTLAAVQATQAGMDPSQLPTTLAAAEPKAMKDTLDEMIDERLMEQQADKAHISVSVDEVDRGIKNKAQQLGITEKELWTRAHAQGFTDQDYRDEVRRQLLEGKLLQLRVAGRVRVTEEDAHATYDRLVKQLGDESPVDLQVIAMRIPQSATGLQAKQALAQDIVVRARSGESFCNLVTQFNEDAETTPHCGSRGPQPVKNILPAARGMLAGMKEGDISNPINVGNQVMIVFRLAKRERVPKYEDVREQMYDQATEEAILHQRELWVKELRRSIYLDVRL